jgi:hypothetical protein
MLPRVVGGAQLPCEAFVLAIVAEDPVGSGSSAGSGEPASEDETTAPGTATRWHAHLLIVSDGFVVKARSEVGEDEIRGFGAQVVELCTGRRNELSFLTTSGHLYVSLTRRPRGEIGVAGHLVRDAEGLLSAFHTRTDLPSLESFGDALRSFPYA